MSLHKKQKRVASRHHLSAMPKKSPANALNFEFTGFYNKFQLLSICLLK